MTWGNEHLLHLGHKLIGENFENIPDCDAKCQLCRTLKTNPCFLVRCLVYVYATSFWLAIAAVKKVSVCVCK